MSASYSLCLANNGPAKRVLIRNLPTITKCDAHHIFGKKSHIMARHFVKWWLVAILRLPPQTIDFESALQSSTQKCWKN
jgi:hypothetical protein